jgi:hypothetical protein
VERWVAHHAVAGSALFERQSLGWNTRGQHRDRLDQPEANQLVVEVTHIALQTAHIGWEVGGEDEESHGEVACWPSQSKSA